MFRSTRIPRKDLDVKIFPKLGNSPRLSCSGGVEGSGVTMSEFGDLNVRGWLGVEGDCPSGAGDSGPGTSHTTLSRDGPLSLNTNISDQN